MTNHRFSIAEEDELTPDRERAMAYYHIETKTKFYALTARHWLMTNPIPDPAEGADGRVNVSDLAGAAHQLGACGIITGVSDGWCRLMKRNRVDVLGQPLSLFLTDASAIAHKANMDIDINDRPQTFVREFICGHDPRETVTVQIELKPTTENGKIISVMSNLTVIEEQ